MRYSKRVNPVVVRRVSVTFSNHQQEPTTRTFSVQFILFALINHDYNNYNNNYAFGRQSRKLFGLFKGLP